MSNFKLVKFAKEVKAEAFRISWASPKESIMVALLVLAVAIVSGLFFLLVDGVIHRLINYLLNL